MAKTVGWDGERDRWLKKHRKTGFAPIVLRLEVGEILDILELRRRRQAGRLFVVKLGSAAHLVPFTESAGDIALRNILPDALATERYLGRAMPAIKGLRREERLLAKEYQRGMWRSVKDRKKEIRRYQTIVRAALQKRTRVNIRMSAQDLEGIQQRAFEEGMPYQTLISSVLHKYVAGRFAEKRIGAMS
jgi:predicted DNA binding CopG/RHH family protein